MQDASWHSLDTHNLDKKSDRPKNTSTYKTHLHKYRIRDTRFIDFGISSIKLFYCRIQICRKRLLASGPSLSHAARHASFDQQQQQHCR